MKFYTKWSSHQPPRSADRERTKVPLRCEAHPSSRPCHAVANALVVLFGRSGVGKLTIGRHLAERTGFRVFHNHISFGPKAAASYGAGQGSPMTIGLTIGCRRCGNLKPSARRKNCAQPAPLTLMSLNR